MKLVLDTSAYIAYGRGLEAVIVAMENASRIFMPVPALAELLSGFRKGTQFRANSARLARIAEQIGIEWIECDRAVAELYASVSDALRRKGRPIPTNDLWIAACCMSVDGTLLATDRHFLQVEGLRREIVEFTP
jgi:predicted nucleic acid-binding protein